MAQTLNQYSFLWVSIPLILVVSFIMLNRKSGVREYIAVIAIIAGFVMAWVVAHPRQTAHVNDVNDVKTRMGQGKPLLLEFQTPYCIVCIGVRPVVDELEQELADQLIVIRLNVQDNPGRILAREYGFQYTPTFILFDAQGNELWRTVGELTPQRVRDSIKRGK